MPTPFCLVILDGFGYTESHNHNPLHTVHTPEFDTLFATCPHLLLEASGNAVGLPEGQMGNSEVGHLHIGAGRKVPQDLTRIDAAIKQGDFQKNPAFQNAMLQAQETSRPIHILGLTSPGGVHAHESHILALIEHLSLHNIPSYYHAILDGRDTPPKSALSTLEKIDAVYQKYHSGHIVSLIGRYYAMDRDKRYERTEKAYNLLINGNNAHQATSVKMGLQAAYDRGETDEFVAPTMITSIYPADNPLIQSGDVVIFMNFRADRARQLTDALVNAEFNGFTRKAFIPRIHVYTLTEYDEQFPVTVIYPPIKLNDTLGEVIANAHLTQLRIAETEKYAHVTYFINGGRETPFEGESRTLIPSPKVATYDLQPEMSAVALTDALVDDITQQRFDFIIVNYANPDMLGHTGNEEAANASVTVIDECIGRVIKAIRKVNAQALITADHGNIECMYDEAHHQPHTAHTTNPVPCVYVGSPSVKTNQTHGSLDDIAPTILSLMGLAIPKCMTGKILFK